MARSYQDFEPDHQYGKGEAHDIIELHVKDFKKEQVRVTYASNGILTVSGERPLEGNRWIRFRKEFNPPKDCKSNEIRARLSSGFLRITIPKKVVEKAPQEDQVTPAQQPSQSQKLKQDSTQGKEAAQSFTGKQQSVSGDATMPTEDPTLQPTAGPKSFISRLKMGRKTAMNVVASLIGLAVLFTVLFYIKKYYATMSVVDQ